jgi:hypothetical protein
MERVGLIELIGMVVVAGLVAYTVRDRDLAARARISNELWKAGARGVGIHRKWLDFDRDTMTYEVSYTAADGSPERTRCKLSWRRHADDALFWERSPKGTA